MDVAKQLELGVVGALTMLSRPSNDKERCLISTKGVRRAFGFSRLQIFKSNIEKVDYYMTKIKSSISLMSNKKTLNSSSES